VAGGRGGGEEAEREEAVDVGAGREAEGVVERELGERHGARGAEGGPAVGGVQRGGAMDW
jgi:hypothetical protein